MIALDISDAGEKDLPNVGFVKWMNAETGETNWIDTSSPTLRKSYREKQVELQKRNEEFFRQLNIDSAHFEVGDHVYLPLFQLFKKRK